MEIRIEGITKRFNDTIALDNVSMHIDDGKIMGILGPSGSGKTTLIRIIAGLTRPDEGRIFFDEGDVTDLPPEKRNVGMVFQNYALFPHMNVEENIGFGLMVRGKKKDEIKKRVEELLKLIGLEGYGKRRISELSGGEMQRVALARALAPGVGILLLDEPLSALDAKLRDSLKIEIKRIQRETGVTMVYVTHDQREALSIADKIAVMNRGRIEQVGSAEEIYWHPANDFVAEFVGEGNVFEAKAKDGVIKSPIGEIRVDVPDGDVKIVIRPETISIGEKKGDLGFRAKLIDIERTGGELKGKIAIDGMSLIFRSYGDFHFKKGDEVDVFVQSEKIHIIRGNSDES